MAEKTSKVVTGSTGNAWQDAPPRVLAGTFLSSIVTAGCYIAGADGILTGMLVTSAGTGAALGWIVFDAAVKPRL